jgi:hypothetical protein
MKNILILVFAFMSFESFAHPVEVEVISAEFGVEDHKYNKSLCLTVARVPKTGELLGLVEGIYDCFYTRKAKKAPRIKVELSEFKKIELPELQSHLQSLDTQLKFLFSQGE